MNARQQHAYEVAVRMARVKELQAQTALANAVQRVDSAKEAVVAIEKARANVASAADICIGSGGALDLARYELLEKLSVALSNKFENANGVLLEAEEVRSVLATENVLAKRYRENVEERLDGVTRSLTYARAASALEEGVELWLKSREGGV